MANLEITLPIFKTAWKDPQKNRDQKEKIIAQIMEESPQTELIIFPELSFHGFIMDKDNQKLAESMEGFCVTETQKLAQKYNVALVVGFIEKNGDQNPYNTAVAIDSKGTILTKYRKKHLFTPSPEPKLYTAGTEEAIFELNGNSFGLSICFDIRFGPLFNTYRSQGCTALINIANWVAGPQKPEIYRTLSAARAIENQCFFINTDRAGTDPNVGFTGERGIFNPLGENIVTQKKYYAMGTLDFESISQIRKAIPMGT